MAKLKKDLTAEELIDLTKSTVSVPIPSLGAAVLVRRIGHLEIIAMSTEDKDVHETNIEAFQKALVRENGKLVFPDLKTARVFYAALADAEAFEITNAISEMNYPSMEKLEKNP